MADKRTHDVEDLLEVEAEQDEHRLALIAHRPGQLVVAVGQLGVQSPLVVSRPDLCKVPYSKCHGALL